MPSLHSIALTANKLECLIKLLPHHLAVRMYSAGRTYFMNKFYREQIHNTTTLSLQNLQNNSRSLWGINFRYPLFNSAGMFKNGEAYDLVSRQSAGGYIGGTSTANPRVGNVKHGIKHPFIPLHASRCSLNYLGLPNLGDDILSKAIITQNKVAGCPIGWSLMRSPDYPAMEGLELLVNSLFKYQANPQIDFIEINESCPNVGVDFNNLAFRLEYLATHFLLKRERNLPIIVKLSTATDPKYLPRILDILFKYEFDGINIGNTSTNYTDILPKLDKSDQKLFQYFTDNFGGGVGGSILKSTSLQLCKIAVDYRNLIKPNYEFHVIRTGGIDSYSDIVESNNAGITLNQWYTGYFSNYAKYGDEVYHKLSNSQDC